MPKVTALRKFEWYPDGKRVVVEEGQSFDASDEQATLLADHGHIAAPAAKASAPDRPTKPPKIPDADPQS